MKKILITVLAVLIVAGGAIGYIWKRHETKPPKPATQTTQAKPTPTTEVEYQGVDGKTALDLLKQSYKVETKSYTGLGEMVTSINGTAADSKHFWDFYVNGQPSQVGAGSYTTKASDKISWRLEAIQ